MMPLDNQNMFQVAVDLSRDCPSISASITLAIASVTKRPYRISFVELICDTTYAADPANYYTLALKHGATTAATFSTLTGAQGAITAATPAMMVLAADTGNNLVAQLGEVLSLVATKFGTAANLTVRVVIHGKFV